MSSDPIVVVGAGPTGALLGIQLARSGADVRIIEKASAPPTDSRAAGIHSRTIELFARLGIADELLSIGHRVGAMNYYSHNRRIMRVDFGHLPGPYPFMVDLPQYETQRILDERLESLGVPVERGVEVTELSQQGSGVTLEARGVDAIRRELCASYVVGCDGAHSIVRHQLQMPFDGQPYDWDWIGADVEIDWGYPESEVHLFISAAGVLACIPYGGGRWRLITPRVRRPLDDRPLDIEHIREFTRQRGPASMDISNPSWLGTFRASRRSAPHYRQGRVFLAGDAAHIHSPAGAQGMNTGLGDAENLGWKMGLVATGRAPESLLDSYEAERAPVARGVIALTQGIMDLFDSTNPWGPLRDVLLPRVSKAGIVQRRLGCRMSQLGVSYRGGPLAPSRSRSAAPAPKVLAGDRAPQVTGLRLGGDDTSLFDLIARPEHSVFALDDVSTLPNELEAATVFRIGEVDPAGRIAHRYGLRKGWVCAIRPDGYVGYVGDAAGLRGYLSQFVPARTGRLQTVLH